MVRFDEEALRDYKFMGMVDETSVIDWEQLDMIADGYSRDFVEICREFTEEIPKLFAALEDFCKANDLTKVARVAHQIKGSAANFGFAGVSTPMAAVEAAAKTGSLEDFSTRLDLARTNFAQAQTELLACRGVQV